MRVETKGYTNKHLFDKVELFKLYHNYQEKVFTMGTKTQSLIHTRWLYKHHLVLSPKYRRKVLFAQLRESIVSISLAFSSYGHRGMCTFDFCMPLR